MQPLPDCKTPALKLFVYGTLKQGGRNHRRFCANARSVVPATVWGRLFHLPDGFPALIIPSAHTLARGTADPLRDADTQQRTSVPAVTRPLGDWDRVHGEIMTLADPAREIPPIDVLEAFRPGRRSLYHRVLATAETPQGLSPVWLYTMGLRRPGKRLASGRWSLRRPRLG